MVLISTDWSGARRHEPAGTRMTGQGTIADDQPPQPPEKPLPSDCCGGGCARCVFDVYDEALRRYELALKERRER